MSWFRKWFSRRDQARCAPLRRFIPRLEELERREVMTVTYGGGALLSAVEVQGLYYGSAWNSGFQNQQADRLSTFMQYLVNSPYMDMLNSAGYLVGRGSSSPGVLDGVNLAAGSTVNDTAIQGAIQTEIANGSLQTPDANRLYVVYVEPNVIVQVGSSFSNQPGGFAGYHGAFADNGTIIHYAVVTTPYGTVNNGSNNPNLGTFGEMTTVASHELAESVTDPNPITGWYDHNPNYPPGQGEIADIYNGKNVTLNGYQVQEVAGINDQALAPTGAIRGPFVVAEISGGVWRNSTPLGASGWTQLTGLPAAASLTAIDAAGDVVAEVPGYGVYRYEDATGWQSLNTEDATAIGIAGDGSVVAQLPGYGVYRYEDATGWLALHTVDAKLVGIDPTGDVVAELPGYGVYLYRDATGFQNTHTVDATALGIAPGGLLVAELGGYGIYRYLPNAQGVFGWQLLDSNVASLVSINENGDVTAQFPNGGGLWLFQQSTQTAQRFSTVEDATFIGIASNGSVVAELPGYGIYLFPEGAPVVHLTTADGVSVGIGG